MLLLLRRRRLLLLLGKDLFQIFNFVRRGADVVQTRIVQLKLLRHSNIVNLVGVLVRIEKISYSPHVIVDQICANLWTHFLELLFGDWTSIFSVNFDEIFEYWLPFVGNLSLDIISILLIYII